MIGRAGGTGRYINPFVLQRMEKYLAADALKAGADDLRRVGAVLTAVDGDAAERFQSRNQVLPECIQLFDACIKIFGNSPFMEGIIPIITVLFFVPSVVYGHMTGVYHGEKDVCNAMGRAMGTMSSYIALTFVAAQFINFFGYTKLGTILALKGAEFFRNSGIGTIPTMILFVLFAAFINLFMGSASAKWALIAPVFVPMFMLLGYTPEFAQVAYRIGDSCTNVITPMMSYFAMIIVFMKKYDKEAGIGTLVSTMLPYSICFLIGWSILLVLWIVLNLPLGPGVGMFLG